MDFEPIPGPRSLPFVGNLFDLRHEEAPLRALENLAEIYGPIYQVTMPSGVRQILVSSAELMKEVMDEKRFMKVTVAGLHSKADGLFVAGTLDPDWESGHRILRPAFGPLMIDNMFDSMKDIAHQLILKWARYGGEEEIALTEDFSNLTLDTIALCTMDYRFNSFYRDGMHPYVAAMANILGVAGAAPLRLPVISSALSMFGMGADKVDMEQVKRDRAFMQRTAQDIIDRRRNTPHKGDDMLSTLLYGKDPRTGEPMRDELIAAQMQMFLVAGHETTSGLLSFAVVFLLQNPNTYRLAQAEVDQVVGGCSITLQHIRDLKYVNAVLQETLRLAPTAPSIGKVVHPHSKEAVTTLGGKYKIEPTDKVRVLLGKSMQDPKVFGEDAGQFKPERMLDSDSRDTMDKYWRPFSQGIRACLGRPFALQEAMLALALILQNFDMKLTDPMYQVRLKQNMTIKPLGLYVKASIRNGMTPLDIASRLHNGKERAAPSAEKAGSNGPTSTSGNAPLTILYGSNTGTCQALAQRAAAESTNLGFSPTVQDMDSAANSLPRNQPVVIVTASYEGEPPENASHFVDYVENLRENELVGLSFAVFGCGHKDWRATFHRIPKLVNERLTSHGGKPIAEIGLSDVSAGNVMADFETWLDSALLPALKSVSPRSGATQTVSKLPEAEAEISTDERVAILRQDLHVGTVKDVRGLTSAEEKPAKRHMEIDLPPDSTYECGDYLAVLPQNPEVSVRAILAHFGLPKDATIKLISRTFAPLPLNVSLSVTELLTDYYELGAPTTRRGLSSALQYTSDSEVRNELSSLIANEDKFQEVVTKGRLSLFDLLRSHSAITLPFATFISLLPPLTIRQYSISSSPLRDPKTCTITYSVVSDEADPEKPFYGVATTYLSGLVPGDRMQVAIRRTAKQTFRLPASPRSTPLLMIAAGSGLAPFRGFIEQRAVQIEANPNISLAPAHLFLGCRSSTRDRLYAQEMDRWVALGAVTVFYAFSREPEKSEGCKYVADRMLKEIDTIAEAWFAGARAYVCGNRAFAVSVSDATRTIVNERLAARRVKEGLSDDDVNTAKAAVVAALSERAADDVFD